MERTTESPIIGATEAARRLRVDKSTLTRWVKDGTLPSVGRISEWRNSALLFRSADVEALVKKRAEALRAEAAELNDLAAELASGGS